MVGMVDIGRMVYGGLFTTRLIFSGEPDRCLFNTVYKVMKL